jgi:D-alanyl-lipoteichoic acid acyltransferase DltB (MBOAT superfamily)
VRLLPLIIGSILTNYAIGTLLAENESLIQRRRTFLLVTGIVINLLLLIYFKYADFFLETVNGVFGASIPLQHIILPLGISFFTFQQVAFLIDTYRDESHRYPFLHYCLFVTFFPQLIAGPIVRHKQLIPQLQSSVLGKWDWENITKGLTYFSIGLFKKVIIADTLGTYVDPVFRAADLGTPIAFHMAWIGCIAFALQIYFDFSGYIDMATGAARLFNVSLPINFFSPYKATNISDLWKRWNITVTAFFMEYLYIPLGGNRRGKLRRACNTMITMLLIGLWHGAGWTFVVWGGLNGVYLLIFRTWRSLRTRMQWNTDDNSRMWRIAARILTFTAFVVSAVFFRAKTMPAALYLLNTMIHINWPNISFSSLAHIGSMAAPGLVLMSIVWFLPNSNEWIDGLSEHRDGKTLLRWQPTFLIGLFIGTMAIASLVFMTKMNVFIYFQF